MYFASQLREDTVHHGGEDMATGKEGHGAGAGGWYPHPWSRE